MSDYIKREDAIKALCDICEALLKQSGAGEVAKARRGKCPIIKAIPAADVVEVVRCRDCEHWECNPGTDRYGSCQKVAYDDFEVVMEGDDFCSYDKVFTVQAKKA